DHLVALALLDVGDGGENRTALPALRRIVADVGPPHRAPLAAADRGVARRADIALADLATLDLVRSQQVRPAPAGKRRGELPRQIDGVGDAGIHAEPAGRDDEMHRIAGEKHAALAVALGKQKILPP